MKKLLYLFLINGLFCLTGCFNDEYSNIIYKEDPRNEVSSNYTYKFVGESEHFYFQTGKVFYGDTNRELLLSNFNLKEEMQKNLKYSINVSFNDKLFYGNYPNVAEKEQQQFKDTVISVTENIQNSNIESDAFLETSEKSFKNSVKIEVVYCDENNCTSEILKLQFVE